MVLNVRQILLGPSVSSAAGLHPRYYLTLRIFLASDQPATANGRHLIQVRTDNASQEQSSLYQQRQQHALGRRPKRIGIRLIIESQGIWTFADNPVRRSLPPDRPCLKGGHGILSVKRGKINIPGNVVDHRSRAG